MTAPPPKNEEERLYRKRQSQRMMRYDREVRQPQLNCAKFQIWAQRSGCMLRIVNRWTDVVPEEVAEKQAVWEIARSMERACFTNKELAAVTGFSMRQIVYLDRIRKGAAYIAACPSPVDVYLKAPFVTAVYGRVVHIPK